MLPEEQKYIVLSFLYAGARHLLYRELSEFTIQYLKSISHVHTTEMISTECKLLAAVAGNTS